MAAFFHGKKSILIKSEVNRKYFYSGFKRCVLNLVDKSYINPIMSNTCYQFRSAVIMGGIFILMWLKKLISFRCRNLISKLLSALYGKFPSISLTLSTVHTVSAFFAGSSLRLIIYDLKLPPILARSCSAVIKESPYVGRPFLFIQIKKFTGQRD